MMIRQLGFTLAMTLFSGYSMAESDTKLSFDDYIAGVKVEASQKGISDKTLMTAFGDVRFIKRTIKLDRNQPERRQTLETYLPKRVPEWKVEQARALFEEHYDELTKIGEQYGVQPRFIVALWGNETNFGNYTGNFDIISALASLAYDGRREAFFRKELLAALTILEQGHISKDTFKGSWAGAMGQTQFMPSSFLAYAVDQDGDGKKDIWNTRADVFGSIANYLKQAGWNSDLTWARQVRIPKNFDEQLVGLKTKKTLTDWQKAGVRRYDQSDLPQKSIQASVVLPDEDVNGRAYLAYQNYDVLMKWNSSYYFVTSVGYLSDRIAFPPIKGK